MKATTRQLDEMGIGFYDRLPVVIEVTVQLERGQRLPDISRIPDWVYRLLAGRLWYKKPNCIGLRAGIMYVNEPGQCGTEIVLIRKDM